MEISHGKTSLDLSNILEPQEYERLRGIKEACINQGKNEDNLYGVYTPRGQKTDKNGAFDPSPNGLIEFDLLPDVLCVNLSDISPIEGIDNYKSNITILDGGELRKGNLKVLIGKPLNERYNAIKLLRLSAGTIDIVTSENKKGEKNIHIPTVHRGRTGFPHAWDMRTTSAGGALHANLATESLREAVEEGGVIGVNKNGEFELCLPELEGVNRGAVEQWIDYAIDTFLKTGGKYDLFMGQEIAHKGNQDLINAGEYAKNVFARNFHFTKKGYGFSPGVLKTVLLSIKEKGKYSYRKSRNMTESDELIQDIGRENFREVIIHEGGKSYGGQYWIDNDPATFHVFRIQTDIAYPEGFSPIFRFYSESGVHYQRTPRIENLTGNVDTTGLMKETSINMKPVPFLQKFALQVVTGRTRRNVSSTIGRTNT